MAARLSTGLGFAVAFVVFTVAINLELEAVRAAYLYNHSLPGALGRLLFALFLSPFYLIGGVRWCLQLALIGFLAGAVASFDKGATVAGALTKIACVGSLTALDLFGPDAADRAWLAMGRSVPAVVERRVCSSRGRGALDLRGHGRCQRVSATLDTDHGPGGC